MKCTMTLLLVIITYCVYTEVTSLQVLDMFPEFDNIRKDPNCRKTKQGLEYKGTMSITNTGKTCQAWNVNTPHAIDGSKYGHLVNEGNFCRGTTDEPEPWCYETDSSERWNYCDIPYCSTRSLGFTVVNPTDLTSQEGEAVKFTKVISSSLSGYDSTTGVFTAPMDGTYLFMISTRTVGNHEVYISVVKNGQQTVVLFMRSKETSYTPPFESDSTSVVLSLKKGDKINGKCISAKCFIDDGSTFTGLYL